MSNIITALELGTLLICGLLLLWVVGMAIIAALGHRPWLGGQ